MELRDHLPSDFIFLDVDLPNKTTVIRFIADTCQQKGIVADANKLFEGMQTRENMMSTGVGGGIGFPHTTSSEAKHASVLLLRLATPIDFEALDQLPVDIVLALIIPANQTTLHLQILARVSRLCRNPTFLEVVRQSTNPLKLAQDIKALEEKWESKLALRK